MNFRPVLISLVCAALALPIVTVLLMATSLLLSGMDDAGGATVIGRLALVAGLFWVVTLVLLVIVQGLDRLGPPPRAPEDPPQ